MPGRPALAAMASMATRDRGTAGRSLMNRQMKPADLGATAAITEGTPCAHFRFYRLCRPLADSQPTLRAEAMINNVSACRRCCEAGWQGNGFHVGTGIGSPISRRDDRCDGGSSSRGSGARRRGVMAHAQQKRPRAESRVLMGADETTLRQRSDSPVNEGVY
jgi:hypothetical protein